ncbi:EamA family transporter [Subtercola lobariae]|uniref:Multidrug transporter n=1 Tax=Subtercola lobariae TaxID=1588641 RepID=A0A917B874_9MICO|nr:EamA family transporter [Subtercola lobariae]GGF29610.1 multidrug transporter [Subtercola lobariae]
MFAALLGITGAFVYGSSDFLGGLASKRISPLIVTATSAAAGLVILLLLFPVLGGAWSWSAVIWGGLSGISGAIALSLLYACLAIGPMSILSPTTAIMSAVVPMTFGLATGTTFGLVGYLGLGVALVAVVLVGFVPEKGAVRPSAKGLIMAIVSGALIGLFLILINQTPTDSGIVPLLFNRGVNAVLLFSAVGVVALSSRRKRARAQLHPAAPLGSEVDARANAKANLRTALLLALGCGVLDAVANVLLLTGIHIGDLAVMSVLTAMYPAGTIILAAIVLRERIAPVQIGGLVLALVAAGMLAVA